MKLISPGRHRDADEFRAHWRAVAPDLDCDTELRGADGALGRPLEVAGRTLTNRFCVHPMEGWDGTGDGRPSEHTRRRWRNFGRSGAELLWGGEAFAVQPDGRANPGQLCLFDDAEATRSLVALREEVRAGRAEIGADPDGVLLGLQLTHSGRFARPSADGLAPRIAYRHPVLDARFGVTSDDALLSDGELEAIGERYVRAAVAARDAGYAFVDVKCCHGYLMHELLGARARAGSYGGSFENRTRLFRAIVAGVRSEAPELALGVRVSIVDVFPFSKDAETGVGAPAGWDDALPFEHGFGLDPDDPRRYDLTEPREFLELCRDLDVRLVNLTVGSPYYCPHFQRPAAFPPSDGYLPPRDPLAEVAEHVRVVRRVREAFPDLVLVGSGYSYLQEYLPHVAQHEVAAGHVDFVGLGRMILSYPELPRDVLRGEPLDKRRVCRTFSDCTTGPRNGMISGCFPLDPYYRALPEADRVKALRPAARRKQDES